jgi:hypothetical protein
MVMLAALSPADDNLSDTLSTLRYASSAKRIVTKAVVNESPANQLIQELRAEIEKLKGELKATSPPGGARGIHIAVGGVGADGRKRSLKDLAKAQIEGQRKVERRVTMSDIAALSLQLQKEMGRQQMASNTGMLSHTLSHPLTWLTPSLTPSLTHSLTPSLTHSLAHSLTQACAA